MPSTTGENTLEPLVKPTDEKILHVLTHGRRETPRNLSAQLTDTTRSYTGDRLRALEIRGYVHTPGPADRSGMYEISTWGRVATAHINKHARGYDDLYHRLVVRTVSSQPNPEHVSNDPDDSHPAPDPHNDTITDWIQLHPHELTGLKTLTKLDGVAIPSDFSTHINTTTNGQLNETEISTNTAADILYTLFFYGLAKRHDGMDAYTTTDRGNAIINTGTDPGTLNNGVRLSDILPDNTPESG